MSGRVSDYCITPILFHVCFMRNGEEVYTKFRVFGRYDRGHAYDIPRSPFLKSIFPLFKRSKVESNHTFSSTNSGNIPD